MCCWWGWSRTLISNFINHSVTYSLGESIIALSRVNCCLKFVEASSCYLMGLGMHEKVMCLSAWRFCGGSSIVISFVVVEMERKGHLITEFWVVQIVMIKSVLCQSLVEFKEDNNYWVINFGFMIKRIKQMKL